MMLINGILCLLAAGLLLKQIKKTQDDEPIHLLSKFAWVYFGLLMILAIHRIFSSFDYARDPWIGELLSNTAPITDTITAIAGIIFSIYLSKRKTDEAL